MTITSTPACIGGSLIGGIAPAWSAVEALSGNRSAELGPHGIQAICLRLHAIPESPTIRLDSRPSRSYRPMGTSASRAWRSWIPKSVRSSYVQKTEAYARAITEACTASGRHCIAGVEPDEPEDISDFERLMNPIASAKSTKAGRNELCPCGTGKKYKRCCAEKDARTEQAGSASGRFRYEPGSYGGPVAGYMLRILCYERSGPDSWRNRLCLVNPDAVFQDNAEAATTIAHDHLATAYLLPAESGTVEDFALSLREAGYLRVSNFRRAPET